MLLHAQIAANKRNTWILGAAFFALFVVAGAAIGLLNFDNATTGVVLALVFGLLYMGIMTANGTKIVMAMNRAKQVKSEDDNPFLWNTVEALAIAARLPMPKVYIIDDASPNAFAAGMQPKDAAVAVTSGLLERLNREEVEAVLAHEMAHVQNYDVRIATTAIALVAVIGLLSDMARRMLWFSGGRHRNRSAREGRQGIVQLIALLVVILAPLIGIFLQMAISRNREYLADASGAELCRNPQALASALRKIAAAPEPVRAASPTCAALYIADPRGSGEPERWGHGTRDDDGHTDASRVGDGVSDPGATRPGAGPVQHFRRGTRSRRARLFATHPPTEERIRRLEQMM